MLEDTDCERTPFSDLITRLLANFASSTGSQIDSHIERALGEVGSFIAADYAIVIQASADMATWSVTHEWCGAGVPSHLAEYQDVLFGTFDWSEKLLLSGEIVRFNSLEETPPEAVEFRRLCQALGFQSSLQLPLRGRGGLTHGAVALSSILRPLAWKEGNVKQLRLLGEVIANVLERKRVEEEVRHSEALFRTTFEQAPVGILNLSLEGRVVRANKRICEMLGGTLARVIDRPFSVLTHPGDAAAVAKVFQQVLTQPDTVLSLEHRLLRGDETTVWGNMTLTLLRDQAENPQKFVATIEDITARKQAEETFNAIPDLILVLDQQHRIVRVNEAAVQRLQCARESLLGQPCYEIMHGLLAPPPSCPHSKLLGDGQPCQYEKHEPRLDGDFLISCLPLKNSLGEVTGSVHVARDITQLRRSEAALRCAHEELQQRRAISVAASLDCVWEWDIPSGTVEYSPRFAELLGYVPDEIPNTLDFFRSIVHADDSELLWNAVSRHLEDGDAYDVECRLRTKDGDFRWFRARGMAQRDDRGQAVWMAGSLQYVHERKVAEMDLRVALQEIERLTKRLQAENVYLQEELTALQGFDEIVGRSELLQSTLSKIEHVAATDASVLLLGETGTGKELLARAIHSRSPRSEHPLVKVNLAALPSSLIESELFGHVKGAYTGAVADKAGRFELADGGTLFLDEIGELELELQTKLLRVLQEGEFERIGSSKTLHVNVRLVAATNRDLRQAMQLESFRPDLYYRLAVFPIEVPPLRLRREDIPLLVWHFVAKKQAKLRKTIDRIPRKVMNALVAYDWPGNVRELENVVERAMILSPGPCLVLEESLKPASRAPVNHRPYHLEALSKEQVLEVLEACHWKIKGAGNAAERLGMNPSTLRYRMKILGIQRPSATTL